MSHADDVYFEDATKGNNHKISKNIALRETKISEHALNGFEGVLQKNGIKRGDWSSSLIQ